jgi:hypothetical protein
MIEISKKKLLYLVEQNLKEMAMDFDTPDRPDQGVQDKLKSGETTFKKVPLPKTGNEPNQNFQEILASERYREVVQNLRRYLGQNTPTLRGTQGIPQLTMTLMQAHNDVVRIERNHRRDLEKLAVELVIAEFDLEEGEIEFDAKIVGMGEIDTDDFNMDGGDDNFDGDELNLDTEIEIFDDVEKLNLEKAKKRLINSLIQGASKKGHYMYHLVSDKLGEITGDQSLINKYGVLMSINDINYWQMSDELINSNIKSSVAGKESVEPGDDENPHKVVARGINFPVLVHELIKGTMEVIGFAGQSDVERQASNDEDTLKKETWDLRLGPSIWNRLRSQFPEEIITDDSKKRLQSFLLNHIFKLPAKEFLVFMKEVLSGSDKGKNLMNQLMRGVNEMLSNNEYEMAMQEFDEDLEQLTNETSGEDLNDILRDLGLGEIDFDDDDELV